MKLWITSIQTFEDLQPKVKGKWWITSPSSFEDLWNIEEVFTDLDLLTLTWALLALSTFTVDPCVIEFTSEIRLDYLLRSEMKLEVNLTSEIMLVFETTGGGCGV